MITYNDALSLILNTQPTTLASEKISLFSALSKVSSTDIFSTMAVPSFRNSAMDGFAVQSDMLQTACIEKPVILKKTQVITAGDATPLVTETHQTTVHIMTGALIPEPYDAVVPIENVTINNNNIYFTAPVSKNAHVRFPGEDVTLGQLVLPRNTLITAENIMLLAAIGVTHVFVYTTPNIYILSTGNEIVDVGQHLNSGQIYNSNAPYLLAQAKSMGLSAQYQGLIPDNPADIEKHLESIPANSVIISTGAVSKGTSDFIPPTLEKIGAKIQFHRVNIRPGKPILFAILPNGSWFFGLPGNPISAAIGFRFFVLPLLQTLQGLPIEPTWHARLTHAFTKKSDFRQFLKASIQHNEQGELLVTIAQGQESFKISPMTSNNAWAILNESTSQYHAGDYLPVLPFNMNTIRGF